MGLTQGEKATIEKARNGGSADLAVNLDDAACMYLLALAVSDLGLSVSGINSPPIDFFSPDPELLRIEDGDFYSSISRAVEANRDIVTYFSCLATLHNMPIRLAGTNRARRIGNSRSRPTGMFPRHGPRHAAPGPLRFG